MGETKTKETMVERVERRRKLIQRLNANSGLQKYMSKEPDKFLYGEALVTKITNEIRIARHKTILHKGTTERQPKENVCFL